MTIRKEEAVALLPFRVLRTIAKGVKVGHCQQVGDAERLRDIALPLNLAHAQRMAANVVCPFGQGQLDLFRLHFFLHRFAAPRRHNSCQSVNEHPAVHVERDAGHVA